MSKGVHNIAFYVSPDPECSRTTQNSEISLAPSRGRILYAIYGNRTCVTNHIVVTAIDKMYHNYYISTVHPCHISMNSRHFIFALASIVHPLLPPLLDFPSFPLLSMPVVWACMYLKVS